MFGGGGEEREREALNVSMDHMRRGRGREGSNFAPSAKIFVNGAQRPVKAPFSIGLEKSIVALLGKNR